MKTITYLFMSFISFCGCRQQPLGYGDYKHWLNNPDNKIIQTKYVAGIALKAQYLPPEYQVYQELSGRISSEKEKDSLINIYNKTITFLLTIAPDERKMSGPDIMTTGLRSYDEYKERVKTMNFSMEDCFSLCSGSDTLQPLLANLENTYGLSTGRNITVVFPRIQRVRETGLPEVDFIWKDNLFTTGLHHFEFTNESFMSVPTLNFTTLR